MSISVNGQSQVPPGFRFHPTEEELLNYYLRKKVLYEKIDLDVIRDVDLNKLEPWDIQEKCRIGSTPQNDWYFFSHKDKKYPTGTRTNRATAAGFWKATGRDKVIYSSFKRIGMRKTLVFYKGRAPHGQKSDWIMHEYRLDDNTNDTQVSNAVAEAQEEGWVVCRIFKKKNHHKTVESSSPMSSSSITAETRTQRFLRSIDTVINNGSTLHDRFMKLPTLESPNSTSSQNCYQPIHVQMIPENEAAPITPHPVYHLDTGLNDDWAALDRLVASHLNGQTDTSKQLACFNDPSMPFSSPTDHNDHDSQLLQPRSSSSTTRSYHPTQDYNTEIDLWSFTRSSPSYHFSSTYIYMF
ncbi:unnamed protein product, partial [Vitis vinifera]